MSDHQRIFMHRPHPHQPRNPNALHRAEQEQAGFNQRFALALSKIVSTMPTAYFFAALAILGLLGIVGLLPPVVVLLVTWFSQTFLQLVFLPILAVSSAVISRKQEIQADAQFADVERSFHDIEQIVAHLDAQDTELVHLESMVDSLNKTLVQVVKRIDQATGRGAA